MELLLITRRFEARRQAIFTDIDRPSGSTWSQICAVCLSEVQAVVDRITGATAPPSPPTDQQIKTLPRIAKDTPLQDAGQYPKPPPGQEQRLFDLAKDVVAKKIAANVPSSPGSARLKQIGGAAVHRTHLDEKVEQGSSVVSKKFWSSPIGAFFSQSFQRRAEAIVCGSPYSSLVRTLFSIDALTRLALASLKEDRFGIVGRDIPSIIRTFTSTINAVDAFVAGLQPHWTDVEFAEEKRRGVRDVEKLREELRRSLEALMGGFGEFAGGLGLSAAEIRKAKDVASIEKPQEMEQRRS